MWGGLASERKEGRWIINSGCFKKSKTLIRTAVSAVFKHTGFPAGPAGSRAPARAAAMRESPAGARPDPSRLHARDRRSAPCLRAAIWLIKLLYFIAYARQA